MDRSLSNFDIDHFAISLGIPHWCGCHSRDLLPKRVDIMSVVINIQNSNDGEGTHWTSFVILNNIAIYFDSFGNLKPPLDVVEYIGPDVDIYYNSYQYQNYNTYNCGALCILFLFDFWNWYKRRHHQHKGFSLQQ